MATGKLIWEALSSELKGGEAPRNLPMYKDARWTHVETCITRRARASRDPHFWPFIFRDLPEQVTSRLNSFMRGGPSSHELAHDLVHSFFCPHHSASEHAFLFAELLICKVKDQEHSFKGANAFELLTSLCLIALDPGGGRCWNEIMKEPYTLGNSSAYGRPEDHLKLYYSLLSCAAIVEENISPLMKSEDLVSASLLLEHLSDVTVTIYGEIERRFEAWHKWMDALGIDFGQNEEHLFVCSDDILDALCATKKPIGPQEIEAFARLTIRQGYDPKMSAVIRSILMRSWVRF